MQYDMTVIIGKTTIHVVAPAAVSEKDKQKILEEMHQVGWAILEKLQKN